MMGWEIEYIVYYIALALTGVAGMATSGAGFVLLIISASRTEDRSLRVLKICGSLACLFIFALMLSMLCVSGAVIFPLLNQIRYYV